MTLTCYITLQIVGIIIVNIIIVEVL